MRKNVANRDLAWYAQYRPDREVYGYGAMSYIPEGHGSGYLPRRIRDIFYRMQYRQDRGVPTIYSFATPIAFYDREHGVWIQPAVSYSITTSKHQGYLGPLHTVIIPGDCGDGDEYSAFASRRSVYDRWSRTVRAA